MSYSQRIRSPRGKTHAWNGSHTACNTYRPRQLVVALTMWPPDSPLSCNKCIEVVNAHSLATLRNFTSALRTHGLLRTPR